MGFPACRKEISQKSGSRRIQYTLPLLVSSSSMSTFQNVVCNAKYVYVGEKVNVQALYRYIFSKRPKLDTEREHRCILILKPSQEK